MEFGKTIDCALIIDGEEAFHKAVRDAICGGVKQCCIQQLESVAIDPSMIAIMEPKPDIIFFRLRAGHLESIHLFKKIKNSSRLKYIPLVAVVDKGRADEVNMAYSNLANCCIEMEDDYEAMKAHVCLVWQFWQDIAELPPHVVPSI